MTEVRVAHRMAFVEAVRLKSRVLFKFFLAI